MGKNKQQYIYIYGGEFGLAYIIPSENFPVPNEFFSCFPTHFTIHSKTTKAESKNTKRNLSQRASMCDKLFTNSVSCEPSQFPHKLLKPRYYLIHQKA